MITASWRWERIVGLCHLISITVIILGKVQLMMRWQGALSRGLNGGLKATGGTMSVIFVAGSSSWEEIMRNWTLRGFNSTACGGGNNLVLNHNLLVLLMCVGRIHVMALSLIRMARHYWWCHCLLVEVGSIFRSHPLREIGSITTVEAHFATK
jgi:hypothetical protein